MRYAIVTAFWTIALAVFAFGFYTFATAESVLPERMMICQTEDEIPADYPCYWDADERGNGQGQSFTAYPDGRVIYDAR